MNKLRDAFGPEAMLFSGKAFVAAMLALWISLALGLKNPYWATSTVYIVAQPLASAVTSKALYRTIGTITGAIATVILVPNLAAAPELLTLAIALWLGLCVFVSLLDRTPRSYAFVLAGYTTAIIGFPSVADPSMIFDTAVSRVEEILLGITCSALVSRLVFPRHSGPMLAAQIDQWISDANDWAHDVLTGKGASDDAGQHRHRLAQDAVEMLGPVSQLSFDTSRFRFAARQVKALQQRMVALLPLISAISDRLDELSKPGKRIPEDIQTLCADTAAWMGKRGDATTEDEEALRQRIFNAKAARALPAADDGEWERLVALNLLNRLFDILDVWSDCLYLRRALERGTDHAPRHAPTADRYAAEPGLHIDYGLAFTRAMPVVIFTLGMCAFWIVSGWQDGALAAMIGSIFCAIFSSRDDQAEAMKQLAVLAALSAVVTLVYQFGILPGISGYPMLVLVLAPYLLICGAMLASPTLGMLGFMMSVNPQVLMQLGTPLNLDFGTFLNSNLAMIAGIAAAAAVVAIVRYLGVEQSAQRIMQAGKEDIAHLTLSGRAADISAFLRRQVDRLGLIVPRLASMPEGNAVTPDNVLSDLRVGINVAELQRERSRLLPEQEHAVARLLDRLGAWFANHSDTDDTRTAAREVLPLIDAAIAEFREGGGTAREASLMALVGIRRGLMPDALPWHAPEAPMEERMAG